MGLRNKYNRSYGDTEVVQQAESERRVISVGRIMVRSILSFVIIGVGAKILAQDDSGAYPEASADSISEESPVPDYTFSDIAKDASLYDPAVPKSQTGLWVDTASGENALLA